MTIEEFKSILHKIMPNAMTSDIEKYAVPIMETMDRYNISTVLRQQHFLAQLGHESGELRYSEEIASGAAYEMKKSLGNIYPGDGRKYKGRSFGMITGRANYTEYDNYKKAKGAIIKNPTLLATNPDLVVDPAGWYWHTRNINKLADKNDLVGVTRRINGGVSGLKDRQRIFANAVKYLKEPVVITTDVEEPKPIVETPVTAPKMSNIDIQRALNRGAKTRLKIDGIIGPKSVAAIKKFQKLKGLVEDGELNTATLIALSKI